MDEQITERLKATRKAQGYSQEQLADLLYVSRQAVSKWERGEASPDTDNLIALARLYGMTVDELLFGKESSPLQVESAKTPREVSEASEVAEVSEDSEVAAVAAENTADKDGEEDIEEFEDEKFENNKSYVLARSIAEGATVFITLAAYLLLGFLGNFWHPAWIIFLAIPIVPSIVEAIIRKNPNVFCFPVFVAAIYLLLGFLGGFWHPAWVIFLAIPLYYTVFEFVKRS